MSHLVYFTRMELQQKQLHLQSKQSHLQSKQLQIEMAHEVLTHGPLNRVMQTAWVDNSCKVAREEKDRKPAPW